MEDFSSLTNVDAQFEILSQLSVRDLLRFKCVSMEWNSIISNRFFSHCQLKKAETVAGFVFQELYLLQQLGDFGCPTYIPLESKSTVVHTTILKFLPVNVLLRTSCNGLICCQPTSLSCRSTIYVCNPINKEWISLKWSNPSEMNTCIGLCFAPWKIPVGEALTNFKLVFVSKSETEEDHYIFEIFLSETGMWRRSQEICKCRHRVFPKNEGVFVDGSLFWLTDGGQIIMFNPLIERSYLIGMPLPSTQFQAFREMCIGESRGKLHFVFLSEHGIQLFVLVDHLDSLWDLTFSISLDQLARENLEFLADKMSYQRSRYRYRPARIDLLAFKDGILLTRVSTNIYSYNFESRKMKRLCSFSDLAISGMSGPIVVPYTMSLLPFVE